MPPSQRKAKSPVVQVSENIAIIIPAIPLRINMIFKENKYSITISLLFSFLIASIPLSTGTIIFQLLISLKNLLSNLTSLFSIRTLSAFLFINSCLKNWRISLFSSNSDSMIWNRFLSLISKGNILLLRWFVCCFFMWIIFFIMRYNG